MAHEPYREPVRSTLARTVAIAIATGAVWAWRLGSWKQWPLAALVTLWPALGGHFVELGYLNYLRARLGARRTVLVGVRLAVWFVGGAALAVGARETAIALGGFGAIAWLTWWLGGVTFIAIELVAHMVLRLRGRPSFYDGCG
jgi:hypothetical protein